MSDHMMITTGSSFEGYEIEEYYGFVASQDVLGTNFIKNITASVADVSEQDKANLDKCKEDAEKNLIKLAKKKKANAIIGMKMEYVLFSSSSFGVIATGTAVKIKKKEYDDQSVNKELVVMNYYTRLVPKPVKVVLSGTKKDIDISVWFYNYKMDDILSVRVNVEFTNLFGEKLIIKDIDVAFDKGNVSLIKSIPIHCNLTYADTLVLKETRVVISKYATPRGVFACNDTPVDINMSVHRLENLKKSRGIDAVEKYRTDGMIWTCNCGHVNEAGSEECIVCGRKQEELKSSSTFNYEEMIDRMREKEYVNELKDVLMEYIQQIDNKYRLELLEIMESGLQYEKTRGNMKDTVIEKVEKVFEDAH